MKTVEELNKHKVPIVTVEPALASTKTKLCFLKNWKRQTKC